MWWRKRNKREPITPDQMRERVVEAVHAVASTANVPPDAYALLDLKSSAMSHFMKDIPYVLTGKDLPRVWRMIDEYAWLLWKGP